MHGDDVASAGVEVTTQVVSKATEILMELLKIAIEKEREANRLKQSEKSEVLSGGEVTYQKLKEGGEVTMLPSFAKEDYAEFLKRAKKLNIPVLTCDATALKTAARNNITLYLMNGPVVKSKWGGNDIEKAIDK